MSIILLYDTLQPTPPLVDAVITEPLRQSTPLQHNRLLQLFHVLELSAFLAPSESHIKLLRFAARVRKLLLQSAKSIELRLRAFKSHKPKRQLVPL